MGLCKPNISPLLSAKARNELMTTEPEMDATDQDGWWSSRTVTLISQTHFRLVSSQEHGMDVVRSELQNVVFRAPIFFSFLRWERNFITRHMTNYNRSGLSGLNMTQN